MNNNNFLDQDISSGESSEVDDNFFDPFDWSDPFNQISDRFDQIGKEKEMAEEEGEELLRQAESSTVELKSPETVQELLEETKSTEADKSMYILQKPSMPNLRVDKNGVDPITPTDRFSQTIAEEDLSRSTFDAEGNASSAEKEPPSQSILADSSSSSIEDTFADFLRKEVQSVTAEDGKFDTRPIPFFPGAHFDKETLAQAKFTPVPEKKIGPDTQILPDLRDHRKRKQETNNTAKAAVDAGISVETVSETTTGNQQFESYEKETEHASSIYHNDMVTKEASIPESSESVNAMADPDPEENSISSEPSICQNPPDSVLSTEDKAPMSRKEQKRTEKRAQKKASAVSKKQSKHSAKIDRKTQKFERKAEKLEEKKGKEGESIGSKIFSWASFLILQMVILFVFSDIYSLTYPSSGYTGLFGVGKAVVVSESMYPTLKVDDIIIYQKPELDTYKEGDIVVYKKTEANGSERLIVHRIVAVEGTQVITCGDNNNGIHDPAINREQICGVVVLKIPYIGGILRKIHTVPGFIVSFGIIAVYILIWDAVRRKKRKKHLATITGNKDAQDILKGIL